MAKTFIHNGTLIDGRGGSPLRNGAVLVEGNTITAAGASAEVDRASGAVVIDAQGGFIMPGLIDTHVHLAFEIEPLETRISTPFSYNFYKTIGNMRRTLEAGITTVRDAAFVDLGTKRAVEDGLIQGPRMQISITGLGATGGHTDGWTPSMSRLHFEPYPGMPDGLCDGPTEVRKKVREVIRAGAEVIKIMATGGVLSPTDHPEFVEFSEEELKVIMEEARGRRGMKVMAHAQGAEGIKMAVRAGVHSIEHGIFLDDEAIDLMLEHGTYLVPTLLAPVSVLEIGKEGGMPEWGIKKAAETIEFHADSIARAYQAGVKIAMGTDAGVMPHGTNLRELGLMTSIGMSPMEAIVATTKTAAECLGWQDRVGTIEAGKLADIVISRRDPLADIRSLEETDNIALVMLDGKVIKNLF